jgi:hypothetical protein
VREAHAAGARRGAHEHTVRSADGVGAAVWSHCVPVATSNVQSSGGRIQDTGRQCDGGRGEMARTHADDARCGAVMRGVSGTATARAG